MPHGIGIHNRSVILRKEYPPIEIMAENPETTNKIEIRKRAVQKMVA
jgi:hypothetical protein